MKQKIALASLVLISNLVYADAGLQEQAKFPFSFSPVAGKSIRVQKADKGNQITATLPDGKSQALAEIEADTAEAGQFPVAQVGDFNFDGALDVGIQDGIGYNGVNMFYRVYLWDNGKLKEFGEPISNPDLNAQKQTVTSSQRSGPAWYTTVFQAQQGKLYPAIDVSMIPVGETVLEYAVFKDSNGKITGQKVVGEATGDTATDYTTAPSATAEIQIDKAYLYDKPKASAKTKMYVIKGDKVTLLDWQAKSTDAALGEGWFLVRYEGKKVIEKWLDSHALVKE